MLEQHPEELQNSYISSKNKEVINNMYDKSPLNYVGGKYKMLPQIMRFFPRRINNMYDLFAGGYCVMLTMNIQKMRCDYAYYLPSERSMFAAF